jgi:glyoxylase-like metal-dependent hydrolase (beta-lactamase superfamily II)
MAMATEAKDISLPLPGGSEGATVRVHPLLCAEQPAPPAIFQRPGGPLGLLRGLGLHIPRSRWVTLPIVAFLVEHPTAGAILVDTAFHESVAHDKRDNLGALAAALYDVHMTPQQAVPHQARERGVDPNDIGHVVMTHLHYDHASGISQFPGATFVVARREWDFASEHGALHGIRQSHFDHAFDWRAIDFDLDDGVESHSAFARTVDLFGDGSVRLCFTPGHTLGHMSVLLRLRDRDLLLCGDAAYTRRAIDERPIPLFVEDEHLYLRSLAEIARHLEQAPDTVVIPGHDPDVWPTLDPLYE